MHAYPFKRSDTKPSRGEISCHASNCLVLTYEKYAGSVTKVLVICHNFLICIINIMQQIRQTTRVSWKRIGGVQPYTCFGCGGWIILQITVSMVVLNNE